MIEPAAVVTSLTHYSHKKVTVTTEGRVVGAVVLGVIGLAAVAMGRLGWHSTDKIVPSSLPDDQYWRRHRVIRRGAASFAVFGAFLIVIAVWAAVTA